MDLTIKIIFAEGEHKALVLDLAKGQGQRLVHIASDVDKDKAFEAAQSYVKSLEGGVTWH